MRDRVTIVGAGPGGLAAAILLAGAGLKVTILERLSRVGGRTSILEADGFRFDVGPTFFLYPQVLEEIFAAGGHDLRREVPMTRLDPQYRLVFGSGGELLATPRIAELDRRVAALSPRDAGSVQKFLDDNRDKFELFRPCIESPFLGWKDLLSTRMLRLLPSLRPWRSLERELASYFTDPRIRLAFSFQSKYLGMSPFQCPSLFSILSFLEYEHGVFHPTGGCGAVTAAMARVARGMGVEIRTDEPVREILFEGRRAVGARTDRATYRSDALLINADFARAMSRLVPDRLRRRWTDARIARKKFSCSTFMLYLGIDGLCEDVPHHSIYIAEDYERNLDEIERRIRVERIVTPADWDQGMEIHRGATFNLAHNLGQMLHLRPRNRFEDLDGVYLVGGGTHPGSGLPVIFQSALITSRLMMEDLGVRAIPRAARPVPVLDEEPAYAEALRA